MDGRTQGARMWAQEGGPPRSRGRTWFGPAGSEARVGLTSPDHGPIVTGPGGPESGETVRAVASC